jgi:predicted dehydrogenase
MMERHREAEACFGCRCFQRLDDLLKDNEVDLVVVAVPSHLHAEHAIRALEAGKHVLVEKPMADNLADADRMIEAAEKAGRILTVNQNYRFTPDFVTIQDVLASGKLGRIILVRMAWHAYARRWDWQTISALGGGQLNNAGAHAVDRALLLMGDAEPEVWCHTESTPLFAGDAESHVKILLRAESAPMIDIELTNACAYPQDEWLVMGTRGGLSGSYAKLQWKYVDPELLAPREALPEPTAARSYNKEELPWRAVVCDLSADPSAGHRKGYLHLYAALREGKPLAVTPESVRRQIAVLEACRVSSPEWQRP